MSLNIRVTRVHLGRNDFLARLWRNICALSSFARAPALLLQNLLERNLSLDDLPLPYLYILNCCAKSEVAINLLAHRTLRLQFGKSRDFIGHVSNQILHFDSPIPIRNDFEVYVNVCECTMLVTTFYISIHSLF